ncbi:MAG: hypothetical protein IT197_09950 [Acidimicrobiia bacterium]|nr:hypothetical protein [Acidimicrobiia bacterium]
MERIVSQHSIWHFDTDRRRFRRVPKGVADFEPVPDHVWEPYHRLDVDSDRGSFTVILNEAGTRLLEAWFETVSEAAGGDSTAEMHLTAVDATDATDGADATDAADAADEPR